MSFHNNDYIMRIIEQFATALASIITTRKSQKYEEALIQIQDISLRYLETNILDLISKSPKDTLDCFTDKLGFISSERCVICAELLHEIEQIINNSSKDYNKASSIKQQYLLLYTTAIPLDSKFQTKKYFEKINHLIKDCSHLHLAKDTQNSIKNYQKFLKQNSKATTKVINEI